jgi:hypothetical protein
LDGHSLPAWKAEKLEGRKNLESPEEHETQRRAEQLDWTWPAAVFDRGDFNGRPLAQPAKAAGLMAFTSGRASAECQGPAALRTGAETQHIGQAGDQKPPEKRAFLHDTLLSPRIGFAMGRF